MILVHLLVVLGLTTGFAFLFRKENGEKHWITIPPKDVYPLHVLLALLSFLVLLFTGRVSLFYDGFIAALVVIIMYGLQFRLIPVTLTLTGIAAGLLMHLPVLRGAFGGSAVIGYLLGFLLSGSILFMLHLLVPHGMGRGDAWFGWMLGAFFGVGGLVALALGTFAATFYGISVGAAKRLPIAKTRKLSVPLGPFMGLGAILYVLLHGWLLAIFTGPNLLL